MTPIRRSGFSLLEVMLATTVLLGSVIVLSHIAFVGTAHMDAAQQYAAAQLVCQARMNEMLAGALPIQEVSNEPIAELPGWGLTVKAESASREGLLALEVTAAELPSEMTLETVGETAVADISSEATATVSTSPQEVTGIGKRFTLVRWIVEPEGSEPSRSLSNDAFSTPVDLPEEPSLFDDSMLPEEPLVPETAPMPEEPNMFDVPIPGL